MTITLGWLVPLFAFTDNHSGARSATQGIVLHSTRGGASTDEREFRATLNWFANPNSLSSAHAVISAAGQLAIVVPDELRAWHAQEMNDTWLGVELTQPKPGDVITKEQYKTLALWCQEMSERYSFPLVPGVTLIEHKDTYQGKRQGRSDIGEPFDINVLISLA